MSGRTGKLTADALRARGPRMVLCRVQKDEGAKSLVIFRAGQSCFAKTNYSDRSIPGNEPGTYYYLSTVAESYTLSYLLKIGKGNQ